MTEREIAEVLRAVPTACGRPDHPSACHETGCIERRGTGVPDYDAMARAVAERLMELGWVNLADAAVCHGAHAACVHVIEDMKLARRSADYWQGQANAFGAEIARLSGLCGYLGKEQGQ